jgi:hypothetical protein
METSREINVTSLDAAHRRALEDIIGTQLRSNHRLIINVTEMSDDQATATTRPVQTLEDWTNVYDGLSDQEMEGMDKIIKARATS